jgi:hypothetical protein
MAARANTVAIPRQSLTILAIHWPTETVRPTIIPLPVIEYGAALNGSVIQSATAWQVI